MNCQECQEKIAESLAASEKVEAEIASHRNACAACAAFCREQQNLYQRVDAGLQSLMNQPVPPSLLPGVRARLDEVPIARIGWRLSWGVTVVAAIALLALSVSYGLRRTHTAVKSAQTASVLSQQSPAPQVVGDNSISQKPQARAAHVLPVAKRTRTTGIPPAIAEPEVIVSTEERRAFADFVADVPEDRALAAALTQPSQAETGGSVEIASLQIDPLEVQLLEGSPSK